MNYSNDNGDSTLIDYYQGAYGPTIRIDIRSLETLVKFRDIFELLAKGKMSEVRLEDIKMVKLQGIRSLVLKRLPEDESDKKSLRLLSLHPEGAVFCWSMNATRWLECGELLDALVEENQPGHQYLTSEGIDDALVEVAFMEK